MARAPAALLLIALTGCFYGRGAIIGGVSGATVGGLSGAATVDDKPLGVGLGIALGYAVGSCLGFMVEWAKADSPPEPSGDGIKTVSGSGDEDHDGIINRLDACPASPEDRDGLADTDGCPEVGRPGDRDEDAVPDVRDRCPDDVGETGDPDGCPHLPADAINPP